MTTPVVKSYQFDLGLGWSPGYEVSTEFPDWIIPKLLTVEEERFLHASLRAMKQTLSAAEQARFEVIVARLRDYLARFGWPAFAERDIADAIVRFEFEPERIVRALVAGTRAPAERALGEVLVTSWLDAAASQARNLMRQPQFNVYAHDARIDLGPVVVDLTRDDPTDYPKLMADALTRARRLSETTLEGMRDVLQDALRRGANPLEAARELRAMPGFALTRGQARAVATYRKALEEGRFGEAFARGLHDLRFTRPPETQAEVDRLVERYADRMASYRARTIARTEMMHAVNAGNRVLWEKAAKSNGYDENEMKRYWVTAPETATSAALSGRAPTIVGPCDICAPIPAMNPEGRRMDEPFDTPEGPVDGPLMHVSCRCSIFYKPDFVAVALRRVRALG